jgi:UDP-glucose 4-epimerase
MRTVVVTGVAGSLGQRVAGLLLSRDDVDRVVGLDVATDPLLPEGVDYRRVDLAAPDGDEVSLAGADGLIHLAWRTADGRHPSPAEVQATAAANHRLGQRVLAAAAADPPQSLVHLSSATVYGAWPDNAVPLSETAPLRPNPGFSFAVEKADAERMVAEYTELHPEVAVAILRPAATVGSPERPLYRALGGTGGPAAGDASRPVQYLHVDDLAAAAVLAWSARLRGVYNVAPDGGIPEETARALAGGVARVSVPERLAGPLWGLGWKLLRLGVPPEARPYALNPWVVASDKLRAAGWSPQYTSEEALVATDERAHWDDLPPGRRQRYTLVLVVVTAVAGALGLGGVGVAVVRRRRARSGVSRSSSR